MRTSRRFHLYLPAGLEAAVAAFAREHGLGLGPAVRLLVGKGLHAESQETRSQTENVDAPAALAALTASEHAVLMVASVLPEGEARMRSLAGRAVQAAEERLALFRQPDEGEAAHS